MAFSKTIKIVRLEVDDIDTIIVRRSIIISEDGVVLGSVPKTNEYPKNSDISGEPAKIRNVAAIIWA